MAENSQSEITASTSQTNVDGRHNDSVQLVSVTKLDNASLNMSSELKVEDIDLDTTLDDEESDLIFQQVVDMIEKEKEKGQNDVS